MATTEPAIHLNSWVPKLGGLFIGNPYAITLGRHIFIVDEGDPVTIAHESIHVAQWGEGFVWFVIVYASDWLYGMWKYRSAWRRAAALPLNARERNGAASWSDMAYRRIRYEQEAYAYARTPSYLERREIGAWKLFVV